MFLKHLKKKNAEKIYDFHNAGFVIIYATVRDTSMHKHV